MTSTINSSVRTSSFGSCAAISRELRHRTRVLYHPSWRTLFATPACRVRWRRNPTRCSGTVRGAATVSVVLRLAGGYKLRPWQWWKMVLELLVDGSPISRAQRVCFVWAPLRWHCQEQPVWDQSWSLSGWSGWGLPRAASSTLSKNWSFCTTRNCNFDFHFFSLCFLSYLVSFA